MAVTQNFVSPANLTHVLAHLRSRSPALVSGCSKASRAGLYDRFVASLRQHRPELLAGVEAAEAAARRKQEVGGRGRVLSARACVCAFFEWLVLCQGE